MRLWHYKLIPYLDKQRLVAQLRECVAISKSIYEKGTPNHILVNKIMDYDLSEFRMYCNMVIYEIVCNRGYKVSESTINKLENYIDFNIDSQVINNKIFKNWHNEMYLKICIYNLYEKYLCGGVNQKEWNIIENKFKEYI